MAKPLTAIYGATGYIGALTARTAVRQGLRPVLIARERERVTALATELNLPVRVGALTNPVQVRGLLDGIGVVLNAAGPFALTSPPLLEAARSTGTHYLDLSGEAVEFVAVQQQHEALKRAGVMAMPGAGFGVVPTDAMAVHLMRRLPQATRLELSFVTRGGVSRGTLATLLSGLPTAGWRREAGELVPAYAGAQSRQIPDGTGGTLSVVTNPWRADLVSAATSTGVANIDTFMALPAPIRGLSALSLRAPWLLKSGPSQRLQSWLLARLPAGPTDAQLASGSTLVHGRVIADDGTAAEAILTGPEAYLYTAYTAVELLVRTQAGQFEPGFQTPAGVHGPELALTTPGTALRDLPVTR